MSARTNIKTCKWNDRTNNEFDLKNAWIVESKVVKHNVPVCIYLTLTPVISETYFKIHLVEARSRSSHPPLPFRHFFLTPPLSFFFRISTPSLHQFRIANKNNILTADYHLPIYRVDFLHDSARTRLCCLWLWKQFWRARNLYLSVARYGTFLRRVPHSYKPRLCRGCRNQCTNTTWVCDAMRNNEIYSRCATNFKLPKIQSKVDVFRNFTLPPSLCFRFRWHSAVCRPPIFLLNRNKSNTTFCKQISKLRSVHIKRSENCYVKKR